jgi:hypothetical protein
VTGCLPCLGGKGNVTAALSLPTQVFFFQYGKPIVIPATITIANKHPQRVRSLILLRHLSDLIPTRSRKLLISGEL